MALFFYNVLLLLLWPVYQTFGRLHPKLRQFRRSRREGYRLLRDYARLHRSTHDNGVIWLHGSSAGELDQALALAREIRVRYPNQRIIISVFSLSVRLRRLPGVDLMFYLPLDLFWNWTDIVRLARVRAFATMTWDVFPNLLYRMERENVPRFLCSAALAADSWRTRPFARRFWGTTYDRFTGIGVVNDENRDTFRKLVSRPDRVRVTGDTRYDTILFRIRHGTPGSDDKRLLGRIRRLRNPVWILASTYAADDREIFPSLPALLDEFPRWQVLIFPHKIDEGRLHEVEDGLAAHGLSCVRFTRAGDDIGKQRLVLVDRMGILALAYRHADFCYVGGGFHHRIHNTAEPAALARPVITGPRIDTSPVALELEAEGCLIRCESGPQIRDIARSWMGDDEARRKAGRRAEEYLKAREGGAARFVETFFAEVFAQS